MIIAEGPKEYRLITQNDHGDLAGQFAAHWGNDKFARLDPYPSMVLAAEARRPADLAARYGGEEFVLLLPNTDAAGCELVGARIRAELGKLLHMPGVILVDVDGALRR